MDPHRGHLIFHATFSGQALSWESGAWERRKEPGKFPSDRRRCLTRGRQPIFKWAPARANKSGDIRETFPQQIIGHCAAVETAREQREPGASPRRRQGKEGSPGPAHLGRVRIPEPSPAAARLPVTCAAQGLGARNRPRRAERPAPPPPTQPAPAPALACVLSNCSRSASRLWPGLRFSTRAGTFLMLFMLSPTVSPA